MEERKLEITQLKNDSMPLMVKFRSALSQKDVDVFKSVHLKFFSYCICVDLHMSI